MTRIINLFGGPGAGKSTTAYKTAGALKELGVNVEYVSEFVKDKKWENNAKVFRAQPYILGKQFWKLFRCLDEVDVVVTDSPLLLSIVYNDRYAHLKHLNALARELHDQFDNINYYVVRSKAYQQAGRNETFEQAKEIDVMVAGMLAAQEIPFATVNYKEATDQIVADTMAWLEGRKVLQVTAPSVNLSAPPGLTTNTNPNFLAQLEAATHVGGCYDVQIDIPQMEIKTTLHDLFMQCRDFMRAVEGVSDTMECVIPKSFELITSREQKEKMVTDSDVIQTLIATKGAGLLVVGTEEDKIRLGRAYSYQSGESAQDKIMTIEEAQSFMEHNDLSVFLFYDASYYLKLINIPALQRCERIKRPHIKFLLG